MNEPNWLPHDDRHEPGVPPEIVARDLHATLAKRRSVRMFSDRPVPGEAIEEIVRCATTAPSGANKQPWRFVAVSDPGLKQSIREAAEKEEREFYGRRATDAWKADLAPLGTDDNKEYLEIAPWLIVVFRLTKDDDGGGVYYSDESVGIATGMLLAAAHLAGLATLTHTPSPMKFLEEVLGRPEHERAYMLIPVGYPADDCVVPAHALERKPLEQVLLFDPASPEMS
ncbi:MAG: nitroreductase family protein [Planctomycetota bacterium]|jgi:nitroreductase